MTKRKKGLPFDKEGGAVTIQRRLLDSPQYLALTPYAKALIHLVQRFWRPNKPVGFGVEQAAKEIPCSKKIAMRTLKELEQAGFIVMVEASRFNSRVNSKTKTWRLTWLPETFVMGYERKPTNDWEKLKK